MSPAHRGRWLAHRAHALALGSGWPRPPCQRHPFAKPNGPSFRRSARRAPNATSWSSARVAMATAWPMPSRHAHPHHGPPASAWIHGGRHGPSCATPVAPLSRANPKPCGPANLPRPHQHHRSNRRAANPSRPAAPRGGLAPGLGCSRTANPVSPSPRWAGHPPAGLWPESRRGPPAAERPWAHPATRRLERPKVRPPGAAHPIAPCPSIGPKAARGALMSTRCHACRLGGSTDPPKTRAGSGPSWPCADDPGGESTDQHRQSSRVGVGAIHRSRSLAHPEGPIRIGPTPSANLCHRWGLWA